MTRPNWFNAYTSAAISFLCLVLPLVCEFDCTLLRYLKYSQKTFCLCLLFINWLTAIQVFFGVSIIYLVFQADLKTIFGSIHKVYARFPKRFFLTMSKKDTYLPTYSPFYLNFQSFHFLTNIISIQAQYKVQPMHIRNTIYIQYPSRLQLHQAFNFNIRTLQDRKGIKEAAKLLMITMQRSWSQEML